MMTPEHLPARRGLAPLDGGLAEPTRRCAQHLRDLREQIGLSSEELAQKLTTDGLRVDKTRLSKFLGGREVPRYEFAARIHQILAEREQRPVDPADVAFTRELIYAAAAAAGLLQARDFELADAREKLEDTRRHTAEQLSELREELEAERSKRQAAEEALADLHSQAHEQAEELRRQREAAERRVGEVEEEIRQAEALLRLQGRDAHWLSELSAATEAERLLLDQDADPYSPEDLHRVLLSWRDYGQDKQATHLMVQLAGSRDLELLFRIYDLFFTGRRQADADRLLAALTAFHDPVALFYFTEHLRDEPRQSAEDVLLHGHSLPGPPTAADTWFRDLSPAMAAAAPLETTLRFYRVCQENGVDDLAGSLRDHVLLEHPEPPEPLPPEAAALYERAREEKRIYDQRIRWHRNPITRWFAPDPGNWPYLPTRRRTFRFAR